MADIQSNIRVNIDTSDALASIKTLQRQISAFQKQLRTTSAENAATADRLQRSLVNDINASGKFAARLQTIKSTSEGFTTALEKNKLSMGEYFKYGASQVRGFRNVFSSEFNTIEKVARERVKTLQTQYISLGRDANGALKSVSVRPLTLDMDNLATRQAIASQRQQIFNQLLKQGSTNLLNFGKNTQWAGRQLMVGFTIPLSIFGGMATKTFMELEEQAIRFKRVYGELFTPPDEADKMLDQLKELSLEFSKYGVSVENTLGLAADAAAMGKMGVELTAQVAEATRLAVLGGVDQQEALQTTISLTNAFGVSTEELTDKINFLNAVENQTVVSIEDLTIAIPKAGPVVKALGGDVEDLAFFLTAMKEGGINASEGANALKSGLARMINPTTKAKEMLGGLGINITKIVEGNAGDIKGTVLELATALDALDPLNRSRAIEQLFGRFQFARLSTLFKNVVEEGNQASRVLELTNATTSELAQLSSRELSRVEESATFKLKGAIEQFQAALAPIGEEFAKLVTPIIDFGTKVLNAFNNLSDGAKRSITTVVTILGAVAPVALMTFGLLANGVANMVKGFSFVRTTILGFGRDTTTLGSQIDYMTQEQLEAASVAASLDQTHMKLTQTFTSERAAVDSLTSAYNRAIQAGSRLRVAPIQTNLGGRGNIKGFAEGGMIRGPGTGTSDSIIARVSNGEAIIPADVVKANPDLVKGLIAGNIPGFNKGGLVKGFSNATIYLPESMNTAMGATSGRGVASSQVASQIRSGGAAGMAPLMAAMARDMGTSINDPKFKAEWARVGDRFAETAATAIENSGREFVKDLDLEEIVVPALKDAAADIEVGGKKVARSLDKTFTEIRTASAVGTQSGSKGALGRVNLGGSYKGLSGQAQRFALNSESPIFAKNTVPSKSRGTKQLFQMRNASSGNFETATMAHVMKSTTMTVKQLQERTKSYLGDVGAKIVKAANGGVVDGVKRSTRQASPSKEAKQAGANIGQGAIQGIQEYVDDARNVGQQIGGAVTSGVGSQSRRRATSGGVIKLDPKSGKYMNPEKFAKQEQSREIARQRVAKNTISRFTSLNSKVQGASFALSSVAGIASMFGGQIGEAAGVLFGLTAAMTGLTTITQLLATEQMKLRATEALASVGGTIGGKGFKQSFKNLATVVKAALGSFGRLIPVIGGALLAFGAVKLLFDIAEEQKKKIAGLGETANLSSDKLKKLGDILGVTVQTIDYKLRGINSTSQQSQEEASQTKQLLENEDFAQAYEQQITAISNSTKDQAERTLQALALQLQSAGFDSAAINAVVNALSQKAGRTDLDLSFANINADGTQALATVTSLAQKSAEAYEKEFAIGFKKVNTVMMNGTETSVDYLSAALQTQLGETATTYKSIFDSLASVLDSGALSAEEFTSQIEEAVGYIDSIPGNIRLVKSIADKMELGDLVSGLTDADDILLAIQAKVTGFDPQKYIDAISGAGRDGASVEDIRFGNMAREELVRLIQEEAAEQQELNEIREAALKESQMEQAYDTNSQAIKDEIANVKLQNKVYEDLLVAGFDAAEAIEAVGDANFYEAYANATTDAQRKELIADYVELTKVIENSPFYQQKNASSGGGQKSVFQEAVDSLKEQRLEIGNSIAAYSRLRKAGFSIKEAFDAAKDPATAVALATTKVGTDKWRQLVGLINDVNDAARKSKLLDLVVERKATMGLTKAFTEITPLLSKMGLTSEEIRDILGDPDLAQSFVDDLKDGEINSQNILYYLNQIPIQKKIDILFNMATPEGMTQEFDKAFNRQMEAFGLRERQLDIEFREPIAAAEEAVKSAEEQVQKAQDSIDSLQAVITDKQKEIELSIDRPIETLNEQLQDIERAIEIDYGRPIESLQEESSDLANDLTLIDKQAESITKQYDEQQNALEKIVEANNNLVEQDKERLDIADAIASGDIAAAARAMRTASQAEARRAKERAARALEVAKENQIAKIRSQSGMTREQIEERQFEISQEIYSLEEQREDKQSDIRDIQDEIYEIEQLRVPLIAEIQSIEDEIYEIQIGQLAEAEDLLEVAQAELDVIRDQKQERLDGIQEEKNAWLDLQVQVDAAKIGADGYLTSLTSARDMVNNIEQAWKNVGTASANANANINEDAVSVPTGTTSTGNGGPPQEPEPEQVTDNSYFVNNKDKILDRARVMRSAVSSLYSAAGIGSLLASYNNMYNAANNAKSINAAAYYTPKLRDAYDKLNNQLTAYGFADGGKVGYYPMGGLIPYMDNGGIFKPRGTDTVPAMLTPGEFVIKRSSVREIGLENLERLNSSGQLNGDSVYNYSVNVSVKSDAKPDDIARAVMTQIKQADAQRIRGNRF